MQRKSHCISLAAWLVTLCLAVLVLGACNIAGYAASAFVDRTVKAQFQLAPQRTLVLVEDPQHLLGAPAVSTRLARHIDHLLVENNAFGDPRKLPDQQNLIVTQRQLHALKNQLGQEYSQTPVDQIARLLEAEQVIYVLVEQADYRVDMAMAQPQATVQVRVLDIVNRRRVFPPAHDFHAGQAGAGMQPGMRVTSQLRPIRVHEGHRAERLALEQALGQRIAEDVARLFHDWEQPDTGRSFQ